jgi:hypothetical protein
VADLGPVAAVLDANQLRARARADNCAGTPSVACAPAQISFQIP